MEYVPVSWRCYNLSIFQMINGLKVLLTEKGRIVSCSKCAVAVKDGKSCYWVCDCGCLVSRNGKYHKILDYAFRDVYVR